MEEASLIEIWAALIQSLAAVVAVAVAFVLGRAQGKYQTQHDESARAVIELRRRALDAEESLETCKSVMRSGLPVWSEEEKKQALREFKDKAWELSLYYRAVSPWLRESTAEKIDPLVWELYNTAAGLILSRIAGSLENKDEQTQLQTEQAELLSWDTQRLQPLLEELDAEASRLAGTARSRLRRWLQR